MIHSGAAALAVLWRHGPLLASPQQLCKTREVCREVGSHTNERGSLITVVPHLERGMALAILLCSTVVQCHSAVQSCMSRHLALWGCRNIISHQPCVSV